MKNDSINDDASTKLRDLSIENYDVAIATSA